MAKIVCPKCKKSDKTHMTLGHGHKPVRCARCDIAFDPFKTELKVGDTVTIYEDPITQRKPEGKAKLVKNLGVENDPLELWEVQFTDNHQRYSNTRWIRVVKIGA